MQPFRVDFKFEVTEQASIYVAAKDEAAARAGAEAMLKEYPEYTDPEVVKVEPFKRETPANPTVLN